MRGRRELFTSYRSEMAVFNTGTKKLASVVLLVGLLALPFALSEELNLVFAATFAAVIGAIGLNLVTGYAGQVSLGHAFFIGLGAYTAAVVAGDPAGRTLGFGVDNMLVWLPAAGIVAALAGLIVSPAAFRLRGLYLAIVTLGLVFIGQYLFQEVRFITGGAGVGRPAANPVVFGFKLDAPTRIAGIELSGFQMLYFMTLLVAVVMSFPAKNIARSAVGRAFAAVRDRDIAAEVMGVSVRRYKALAFTVSSFYAGVAGALLYSVTGFLEPGSFSLLLSVQYIAMVLIGGVATISGSIMGAAFVTLLPRLVEELPHLVPFVTSRPGEGVLSTQQLELVIYGALIIVFLIFEPRGLYGLWVRVRNYWRAWPFSY